MIHPSFADQPGLHVDVQAPDPSSPLDPEHRRATHRGHDMREPRPVHADRSVWAEPAANAALPIVLLHGWGMNLRVFDPLRAQMPGIQTLAVDLPGHGRSPWWPGAAEFDALCRAVMEVLPQRCTLVGWSLGAEVALALAAHHPARVESLVLLAATPKFAHAPDWPHGMRPEPLRAFRTVLEQDWVQTLEDFIWLQVRGSQDADAVVAAMTQALRAHGEPQREALLAGLQLLADVDLRHLVPRIAQRTLIISGRNDRVTPPGATQWLAQTLPDARLHLLPRAGHAPHLSHTAEVAQAMRAFLQ